MKGHELANRYTMDELAAMAREIRERERIPVKERRRTGSIEMFPPNARKKLDEIAWAITYQLRSAA